MDSKLLMDSEEIGAQWRRAILEEHRSLSLAFKVLEQQLFATRLVRGSQLFMLSVKMLLSSWLGHLMETRSLGS